MAEVKRTAIGIFVMDRSGLIHYRTTGAFGTVFSAADDATANRPEGAVWFWFNGTYTPMLRGDSSDALCRRWNEWRESWNEPGEVLITRHERMAEGAMPVVAEEQDDEPDDFDQRYPRHGG